MKRRSLNVIIMTARRMDWREGAQIYESARKDPRLASLTDEALAVEVEQLVEENKDTPNPQPEEAET